MRGGCDGEFAEHSPDQFPGPGYVLFFFPVLQVGHDGFHMGADLFGGPLLVCHVGDAEVDQLRFDIVAVSPEYRADGFGAAFDFAFPGLGVVEKNSAFHRDRYCMIIASMAGEIYSS